MICSTGLPVIVGTEISGQFLRHLLYPRPTSDRSPLLLTNLWQRKPGISVNQESKFHLERGRREKTAVSCYFLCRHNFPSNQFKFAHQSTVWINHQQFTSYVENSILYTQGDSVSNGMMMVPEAKILCLPLTRRSTDYVQALFQRYKNEDGIATVADFPAIYSFAQVFTDNLLLITKTFVYIAFPENVIKYGHPLCSSETTAVPCLTSKV